MTFDTTSKSLLASLLIHCFLVGGYFIYIYEQPLKIASKEKIISMDLQTLVLPKQNIVKQEPKPKKIEKPKPEPKKIKKQKLKVKPKLKPKAIKKIEAKFKPITPKKTEPKPLKKIEPEKEESKPISEPKPIQKPLKTIKTQQVSNKQTQQQTFRKTNFAIIRDMILSNLEYPNVARKMGWQGVVKIKLVINSKGKLTHYAIVNSSKKKQLDNAALEAVESIADTNLPKPKYKTTLVLPISFTLN